MKKTVLLSLILLSGVLLTACGKNDEVVVDDTTTDVALTDCQKAINKYLDGADKSGKWNEVKSWDNIVVDYIWRLPDGTVFDTSIRSIAEACGTYSEGRDYTEWLSFQAWAGQMIKWFDDGVIGMKVWQTKTVQFGAKDWYGEYDKSLVATAPIDEVWDISQFSEGDTVYLWMWYPAKIVKITDKEVTFDMNHELAGKDLIFDITMKSIN